VFQSVKIVASFTLEVMSKLHKGDARRLCLLYWNTLHISRIKRSSCSSFHVRWKLLYRVSQEEWTKLRESVPLCWTIPI